MNKLTVRRVLKKFSEGEITWRETICQLNLDDYTEILVLLHQHSIPLPNAAHDESDADSTPREKMPSGNL